MTERHVSAVRDDNSVLFLFSTSPQSGTGARDGLDTLLAYAAFDTQVAVVFLQEGIWQLCANQLARNVEQKALEKSLQVLPLYDINEIYIHEPSLCERGIEPAQLLLADAKMIDDAHLSALLRQYTHAFRF